MNTLNTTQNRNRHKRIYEKYTQFSVNAIYAANIKIAAKEWAIYLNSLNAKNIAVTNNGATSSSTFAIIKDRKYVPNKDFIDKCIKKAKKKGERRFFAFCYIDLVLDKLERSIVKSSKK